VALATAAAVALSPARSGSVRASEEGAPMRLQRWFPALGLALALGSAVPGWLLSRSLARAAAAPSADGRLEALQEASRLAPDDGAIHARIAREAMAAKPPRVGLAALEIQKACEAEPAQAAYRAQWAELRGASR
ncbi:MAG: hypothetical protein NTX64_10780, partial [Elusimicrobia bacterium]|nr:hypothetical protein [Elusimicrobiota bacterium]